MSKLEEQLIGAFAYVVLGYAAAFAIAFGIALPIIAVHAWRHRNDPRQRYTSYPGVR